MSARGLVHPALLVLVWQLSASLNGVQSDTLASPLQILKAFAIGLGSVEFWRATADTLLTSFAGLLLGGLLGAATGLAFGLMPPLSLLMKVPVEVLRPIPAIALVPIAILFLGFGYILEISIVAFAVYFPILILIKAAVRGIEPRLLEVGRVLKLRISARVRKIVVPAVLPRAFVAFRLAAGLALVVAITVEIAANPQGLGSRLILAAQSLRAADMFATLLWVGLLGWMVNAGLMALQSSLFPSEQEAR